MMADSERGVSKTRSSPNLRCRSSVTRKTPPLAPMSCPSSTTRLSRSSSSASAEFKASIIVICIKCHSDLYFDIPRAAQAPFHSLDLTKGDASAPYRSSAPFPPLQETINQGRRKRPFTAWISPRAAQAPTPHIHSSPAPTRFLGSAGGRHVVLRGEGVGWPWCSQRSCRDPWVVLLRQCVWLR